MTQMLQKETAMDRLAQDYIVCSYLWNGTTKDYIDSYGYPVFDTPEKPVFGVDEELIDTGVINFWENEVEGLKDDNDGLNEYYRQFPRTEEHAFRDEAKNSIFNLNKIYEQIDYNEDFERKGLITRGSFYLGKWYKRYQSNVHA